MKLEWRKSANKINGVDAIEHIVNMNARTPLPKEHETTIAGYYGEIWEKNDQQIRVLFTSTVRARQFAKLIGVALDCTHGDEPLFTVDKKHLPNAMAAIKTPKSLLTRAKLASEFRTQK